MSNIDSMHYVIEWSHGNDSLPHVYRSEEGKSLPEVINMIVMTSPAPEKLTFMKIAKSTMKGKSEHVLYL